jgi:hypothetical protein
MSAGDAVASAAAAAAAAALGMENASEPKAGRSSRSRIAGTVTSKSCAFPICLQMMMGMAKHS